MSRKFKISVQKICSKKPECSEGEPFPQSAKFSYSIARLLSWPYWPFSSLIVQRPDGLSIWVFWGCLWSMFKCGFSLPKIGLKLSRRLWSKSLKSLQRFGSKFALQRLPSNFEGLIQFRFRRSDSEVCRRLEKVTSNQKVILCDAPAWCSATSRNFSP